MDKGTQYGAFNARWLKPEEVARRFVPLTSFSKLIREGHSILMGPRGCGKTTLLKMLTRRAINEWYGSERSKKYPNQLIKHNYEAIYIPSDIRWSYEIRDINIPESNDPNINEQVQRIMMSASTMGAILDTTDSIISDMNADDEVKNKFEILICESLIDLWKIPKAIPSLIDLGTRIEELVANIRGIIKFNCDAIAEFISHLPPLFYSNALDLPIISCKKICSILPVADRPSKWAICYDELEIAPIWLHEELLSSLRSIGDQDFFLKLTWTPILPSASSSPEPAADYTAIRLWYSHVNDPKYFCEDLATSFLSDRYPNKVLSPSDFLGDSFFASEDEHLDGFEHYKTNEFYTAMKNLAEFDSSFRDALINRHIDPQNPQPPTDPILKTKQLNEFFRKAKPIVFLREAFLTSKFNQRSRKSVTLYAGKQTVFAVSEGNPRLLLSLLNDLADAADFTNSAAEGRIRVKFSKQAVVINATSRRFEQLIKATPVSFKSALTSKSLTIHELVTMLAAAFREKLYGTDFPLDPIGSIRVIPGVPKYVLNTIKRGIEIGALVHIGKSPEDVPSKIINERFRLSFLLCPSYKLPLRNYKEMDMDRSGHVTKRNFLLAESLREIKQMNLELEK
jgi:GTPase SAR1 family protein